MKLSACWITKNEEGNIGRSIESLKGAVDDMIVVDTGSTDNTKKEAEEAGARVLDFEWIGDFAAAKNFALNQAEHGIVIFLDADEYFEPKLGDKERNLILNAFKNNKKAHVASVRREDIQTSDGSVMQKGESNRILRHNGENMWRRKIHEEMTHNGGKPTVFLLDLLIKHTGYSREVLPLKLERNSKMLEDSLSDMKDDSYDAFSQRVYMVRETQYTDPPKSFANLKIAMPQTANWEYGISRYQLNYLTHLFRAIFVAAQNRDYLNRKFVYEKLFAIFKKHYSKYLLGALTDLLYIYWFDKRDDKFLERFEADIEKALEEATAWPHEYYDEDSIMQGLYAYAAEAYERRGRLKEAAKWAKKGFNKDAVDATASSLIDIIINAGIDGDPVKLIENLNALYPSQNIFARRFLLTRLLRDDAKALYSFFLKQHITSFPISADDRLFYALLTVGPQGALEHAQTVLAEGTEEGPPSVAVLLFMISVIYDAKGVYENNKDGLTQYRRILDAYFVGGAVEDPTDDEQEMIKALYPYIAFLGGKAVGDRLLSVLSELPRDIYMIKSAYYLKSRDYAEVLAMPADFADADDWYLWERRIRAAVNSKNYELALKDLAPFIETQLNGGAAEKLLLIAELASGETQKTARKMYDEYMAVFEDSVDISDIKNTGIIPGKKNVYAERELAALSAEELLAQIDAERKKRHYEQRTDVVADALGYYEAQHDTGRSRDALIELIGAGRDVQQNTQKLKDMLEKAGNTKAAMALA